MIQGYEGKVAILKATINREEKAKQESLCIFNYANVAEISEIPNTEAEPRLQQLGGVITRANLKGTTTLHSHGTVRSNEHCTIDNGYNGEQTARKEGIKASC